PFQSLVLLTPLSAACPGPSSLLPDEKRKTKEILICLSAQLAFIINTRMIKKHKPVKLKKKQEFLFGALTGFIFILLGVLAYFSIQDYKQVQYIKQHPFIETK